MGEQLPLPSGTVLWIAPFYNRSGYAVGARSTVAALHRAGVRIRIYSSKDIEPGIDDCDLDLIRSLEATPLIPPVTAIICHVPHKFWLGIGLPEPNLRIIATTFDSSEQGNRPPADWIEVCNGLDQVWLMAETEREAFISAGLPSEKIQIVWWPHHWLENPFVPPIQPEPSSRDKPFRFVSIAMFQPRRRWDTLIEAYLEEFKGNGSVELYLKVNYPSWHPVPGKPRQDFHNLVDALRKKTGSEAAIVIDEDLGTRSGIVRLIDSCNVYISTDTAATSPISEARVRHRLIIIPEGLGLGNVGVCIAVDPDAKTPITEEMLLYQPHHKGASMPQLHVNDVRRAMRRAYEMTPDERHAVAVSIAGIPGPSRAVPMVLNAINAGWEYKEALEKERQKKTLSQNAVASGARFPACQAAAAWEDRPGTDNGVLQRARKHVGHRITWEGTQLVTHSLAHVNRELCLQLIDSGFEVSIIPGAEADNISPDSDPRFEKIVQRTRKPLSGKTDVHVRHHWPPNFNPPRQGHWVMMQPWEYGRLPESWVEPMANLVDEIWAYSRHVLKTYIASGIPADRVKLVPLGVNVDQFNPSAQKHLIHSEKKFKFLFVGVAIWRKGVDLLLEAYRSVFDSRDDVVLVIKDLKAGVFYLDQGAGRIIREIQKNPKAPEIVHIEAPLDPWEMPGLYTACDCMVLPYRAEGFALPVLEAMACGIPVITTAGGSTDDFCPPDYTCLIPARRIEFNPSDVKLVSGGGWVLEPDLDALETLMREVYENYRAAKDRALKLSGHISSLYDWKNIASKVAERIHELIRKPVLRGDV